MIQPTSDEWDNLEFLSHCPESSPKSTHLADIRLECDEVLAPAPWPWPRPVCRPRTTEDHDDSLVTIPCVREFTRAVLTGEATTVVPCYITPEKARVASRRMVVARVRQGPLLPDRPLLRVHWVHKTQKPPPAAMQRGFRVLLTDSFPLCKKPRCARSLFQL